MNSTWTGRHGKGKKSEMKVTWGEAKSDCERIQLATSPTLLRCDLSSLLLLHYVHFLLHKTQRKNETKNIISSTCKRVVRNCLQFSTGRRKKSHLNFPNSQVDFSIKALGKVISFHFLRLVRYFSCVEKKLHSNYFNKCYWFLHVRDEIIFRFLRCVNCAII